ncbi:MAG: hypothetical protein ABSH20_10890 [Tepidisphaeraceae bacterium]
MTDRPRLGSVDQLPLLLAREDGPLMFTLAIALAFESDQEMPTCPAVFPKPLRETLDGLHGMVARCTRPDARLMPLANGPLDGHGVHVAQILGLAPIDQDVPDQLPRTFRMPRSTALILEEGNVVIQVIGERSARMFHHGQVSGRDKPHSRPILQVLQPRLERLG